MPRKKTKSLQRDIAPDRKYDSVLVQKFINKIMIDGKKQLAEALVYAAIEKAAKTLKEENELAVFEQALKNASPHMEVKSRRVGGATYQVPVEVRPARRSALAMRWLVDYSRKRGEKSMALRLAGEILDAAEGKGAAVKKREDVHRMAEANKAFSHFRF